MSHYQSMPNSAQPYDADYGEEEEDDEDGFDYLTDYDDETDYLDEGGHHHNSIDGVSNGSEGLLREGHLRRHRSISEGSPQLLDPNDDNRRDHHNQLERKRRASIKTSYTDLREVIPGLRGSKASRAVILQRAVECIKDLTKRNREHTQCVETLTRQNEVLDRQVQDMNRNMLRLENDELYATAALGCNPCITGPACVRYVPAPASVNATNSISTTSGSSATSPTDSTRGLPVYRLIPHEAPSIVDRTIEADSSQLNASAHPVQLQTVPASLGSASSSAAVTYATPISVIHANASNAHLSVTPHNASRTLNSISASQQLGGNITVSTVGSRNRVPISQATIVTSVKAIKPGSPVVVVAPSSTLPRRLSPNVVTGPIVSVGQRGVAESDLTHKAILTAQQETVGAAVHSTTPWEAAVLKARTQGRPSAPGACTAVALGMLTGSSISSPGSPPIITNVSSQFDSAVTDLPPLTTKRIVIVNAPDTSHPSTPPTA